MSHILRMPGVPESSRALLMQLLAEDLIPVEALPHIIESYRQVIVDAYRRTGRANMTFGNAIADAANGLLRSVTPETSDANLRLIQAAIRYFVIQDDGVNHDLASPNGLDDDVRVMNAVLRFLGRDDLFIEGLGDLPPRRHPDVQSSTRTHGAKRQHAAAAAPPAPAAARDAPTQRVPRPGDGEAKRAGGLLSRLRRSRRPS